MRDGSSPKFVASITDKEDREPERATPNANDVMPERTMLLTSVEEPALQQSSANGDASAHDMPNDKIANPMRAKLLTDDGSPG